MAKKKKETKTEAYPPAAGVTPNTQNPQPSPTQTETSTDEVEIFYDADEVFPIQKPGYPFLDHTFAGIFHISEEPHYPISHIVTTKYEYPLNDVNTDKDFCLSVQKYDISLKDYLQDKGPDGQKTPVKMFLLKTGRQALVPRDYARQLARGIINAYIELGSEEHLGLNMIENYVVVLPAQHPYKNSLLHSDYDQDIKVKIIRKVTHPDKHRHTDTPPKRNNAVMLIIFKHLLEEQRLDGEWQDFRKALKNGKLNYCLEHPCLKKWETRLLSFVKLSTMISNRSDEIAKMVYEAMTECTKTQLYTNTWEQQIHGYHPLEQVRNFHIKKEAELLDQVSTYIHTPADQSRSRQHRNYGGNVNEEKWVEGGLLVKFIANCYKHLTETLWMNTNFKQRSYKIDEAFINDDNYRQLRFLDTLITYFVYPGLLVALYRKLHERGYDL